MELCWFGDFVLRLGRGFGRWEDAGRRRGFFLFLLFQHLPKQSLHQRVAIGRSRR